MKRLYIIFIPLILSVLSLAVVVMYNARQTVEASIEPLPEEPEEEEIIINYVYQIPSESFLIKRGQVRRNETFSVLLNSLGIPHAVINEAVNIATGIFDARRFRAGNNYAVFHSPDSTETISYFVYEKSPVNFVVFQFADSLHVWEGEKDIDIIRKAFTGKIESSLWNAFTNAGSNPMLSTELSEIYAWTIDFFGLQKGDSFSIIYDEYYIEDIPHQIGQVHGAYFRHRGRELWAIPFDQDDRIDFFDDEGSNLRKAFLKAPLRYSRISSGFSHSRMHPVLRIRRPHHGVDYAAPTGTPVMAVGDGVVVKAGYEGAAGNMVRIRHNSTYSTAYLHLSRFGKGIRSGAYVKQGDIIGYVGSTGLSTGPHLDFRFYRNGQPIDPLRVESPPVDPVREENLERFTHVRDEVMGMLGEVGSGSGGGSSSGSGGGGER